MYLIGAPFLILLVLRDFADGNLWLAYSLFFIPDEASFDDVQGKSEVDDRSDWTIKTSEQRDAA